MSSGEHPHPHGDQDQGAGGVFWVILDAVVIVAVVTAVGIAGEWWLRVRRERREPRGPTGLPRGALMHLPPVHPHSGVRIDTTAFEGGQGSLDPQPTSGTAPDGAEPST